jgi:hypothetical protein
MNSVANVIDAIRLIKKSILKNVKLLDNIYYPQYSSCDCQN